MVSASTQGTPQAPTASSKHDARADARPIWEGGALRFGPRRGQFIDASADAPELGADELRTLESFDVVYRSLCATLYNYVPLSGHPGGSISSGRIVQSLMFRGLDLDLRAPSRRDADTIVYAAGHKALGLYSLWALRDEIARLGAPKLLPAQERDRLRLEDLIGFRHSPAARTPTALRLRSRMLDGHPTPATPFVKVATGASGVGMGSALGLALGALDLYGKDAPRVHVIEGEGGLTPGRVAEVLATAGTLGLSNAIVHVDWNQASIDSEHVCRDGAAPGDYVQWDPLELFWLHDWNVLWVPDGFDYRQILAAQGKALALDNGQPTAIVYRTVKGWQYGIEGKASHGAGHKLCSPGFRAAVRPLELKAGAMFPRCDDPQDRCANGADSATVDDCFWDALTTVRRALESDPTMVADLSGRLTASLERLDRRERKLRVGAPDVAKLYALTASTPALPESLRLKAGTTTTLRGELARVLQQLNVASGGAVLTAAADLLGSTSVAGIAAGLPAGTFHSRTNPAGRLLTTGGICEDGMSALLSGLVSQGGHVGVGASYGAFLAPLGHIAARLHAIGQQTRAHEFGGLVQTMILVCAHAGLKTGEDGPTHADPQALQLLQDNFPPGTAITLTPWDPQEIWTLVTAALAQRPALLAPFVTRPSEPVIDRAKLELAPFEAARTGLYRLRAAVGRPSGTLLLQGSAVTYAFLLGALPHLLKDGLDLDVFYVASAELFDAQPEAVREELWPEARARAAMGITDFTMPTLWRWVTSSRGRAASLHPFGRGRFLGSGPGDKVLSEAGLDGESQADAIRAFCKT
ncbi:MAG: transketolase-like TK C-terminal-containing protein [Polyangiales bacterium]